MKRISKILIILVFIYGFLGLNNNVLGAINDSFEVNLNMNFGDIFNGSFDDESKLQNDINNRFKDYFGIPKQNYKIGTNKFSYDATVKVGIWYDSTKKDYIYYVNVNGSGKQYELDYYGKSSYSNKVTELNSRIQGILRDLGIKSYPEKITAEELPDMWEYSKTHKEPEYKCKINAIVTIKAKDNRTRSVTLKAEEGLDISDKVDKDSNEEKNSEKVDGLTKIQDYNNEIRYITSQGAKSYKYDSNSKEMQWTGITYDGGVMVSIKAKYKDSNKKEWVELNNGKYVEANNLQVDAPVAPPNAPDLNNPGGSSNPGGITEGNAISFMNQGTAFTDPTTNANSYKPANLTTADTGELTTMAGTIIGIVRNIGVVLGVIFLTVLGLRYMFASIAEKAEYKETMMPYVLGAILLMAGTVLVDVIYHVATTW